MINKKNVLEKPYLIGSWIQIGNPNITSMMIKSGFDFLVMDMEHGSITESDLEELFEVFTDTNCIPMVRVAKNNEIMIRRVLDLGAKGIILPNVNSLKDINKAVKAIFYPPDGARGIGFSKANNYGIDFDSYFNNFNENIILVGQIENKLAVQNIDDIFSSSKINSYIIGPYDLTGSMGITGEFDNQIYLDSLKKIKNSADKNNIKSGIHVVNPDINELRSAISLGYYFIAYSTDALLIYDRCKNDLDEIKKFK
tara:strand:- start:23802 stop:24563 length:762 start_codon:yes stop_codon:yes gene_type:complete